MKILHTADLHLREYEDERWKSLKQIMEVGKQENIELLLISGDLFDKDMDSEKLRPKIREIFSNNKFRIIILPGNHDSDSYKNGFYFGENVTVLNNPDLPLEFNNVCIWGFPFESLSSEDILSKIRLFSSKLDNTKINILMIHGELLDAFYSRDDFGDEGKERYMPIKLSYFKSCGFDYVLAGHFHTNFNNYEFDKNKYFVYPGSPVSITKKEINQRKVNVFEVGQPPHDYLIDTFHYVETKINLNPFDDTNPVEVVKKEIEKAHKNAKIIFTITGYINSDSIHMSEQEIVQQIKKLEGYNAEFPNLEFIDIKRILEDALFDMFYKKVKAKNYPPEKEKELLDFAIRAMMEVVKK